MVAQASGVPHRRRPASKRGGASDSCGVGTGQAGVWRVPEVKVWEQVLLHGEAINLYTLYAHFLQSRLRTDSHYLSPPLQGLDLNNKEEQLWSRP